MIVIRIKPTEPILDKIEVNRGTHRVTKGNEDLLIICKQTIQTRVEPGDFVIYSEEKGVEMRRIVPEELGEDKNSGEKLEYISLFFFDFMGASALDQKVREGIRYRKLIDMNGPQPKKKYWDHFAQYGFALDPSTVFPGECYVLRFVEEVYGEYPFPG